MDDVGLEIQSVVAQCGEHDVCASQCVGDGLVRGVVDGADVDAFGGEGL
jgi:hypothetical protein